MAETVLRDMAGQGMGGCGWVRGRWSPPGVCVCVSQERQAVPLTSVTSVIGDTSGGRAGRRQHTHTPIEDEAAAENTADAGNTHP